MMIMKQVRKLRIVQNQDSTFPYQWSTLKGLRLSCARHHSGAKRTKQSTKFSLKNHHQILVCHTFPVLNHMNDDMNLYILCT